MEITDNTFNDIIKLKDTDDIFEKTLELLDFFRNKYKDISNLNDEKIFKTEVKIIFELLHHVFTSEEELEDLDEEDAKKFEDLVFNIRTVINSIDDYDLKKPTESVTSALNYVLEYFKEGEKDMRELNETIAKTNESLEKLQNMLEDKQRLDEICRVLKEDLTDKNKEYLQLSAKWCQLKLKEHNKDLVLKVIENKHASNPVNYCSQATELLNNSDEVNIEKKKELNNLVNIDLIMTIFLSIENKLKTEK